MKSAIPRILVKIQTTQPWRRRAIKPDLWPWWLSALLLSGFEVKASPAPPRDAVLGGCHSFGESGLTCRHPRLIPRSPRSQHCKSGKIALVIGVFVYSSGEAGLLGRNLVLCGRFP